MAAIKTFVQPKYLYRYRSLATKEFFERELASLKARTLWCSHYKSLNDPMEGSYRATLRVQQHSNFELMQDHIFGQKSAVGICSFSETNDNPVMWAHYADQFRGICIEYDFERLLDNLGDGCEFVRIVYNEKPHSVALSNLQETELAKKILSTKSHTWLYEREWRLFAEMAGPIKAKINCVSCVYIGNRLRTDPRAVVLVSKLKRMGLRHELMSIEGYNIDFAAQELDTASHITA